MSALAAGMLDAAATSALAAYRLAGYALMPLVPMLLSYRTAKGKEDRTRRDERYGYSSLNRPAGPLVWIHAASVGEVNAILPLVGRIVAEGLSVLVTTVTVTSARIAEARLPSGAFHQYSPLDIVPFVDRFLDNWKPDLAVFIESELWPNTMAQLASHRIPQVQVNARMSPRSFARWRHLGTGTRKIFQSIAMTLAQSEGDAERLRQLGMRRVSCTGNLKFDVPPPAADPDMVTLFRDSVRQRDVFVAASTHEGEEEIIAAAHQRLRLHRPELLTIIAPRHPGRGAHIRDQLASKGLVVALRSRGEPVTPDTDIYLADTLGELGIFYRIAPVVFMGGSLIPHGGQNPIEPVSLDSAILHGPHVHNFADIYAALDQSGRAEIVGNSEELAAVLDELFADPAAMRRRATQAAESLAPYTGALDATMRALVPYLQPLTLTARLKERDGQVDRRPTGRQ